MQTFGRRPSALALAALALFGVVCTAYDTTVCDTKFYASPDKHYSYNPNAWNPVNPGFQCMAITNTPPSFDATWMWQAVNPYDVHSFPYVKFLPSGLPTSLSNVTSLVLSAQWTMQLGSTTGAALEFNQTLLEEQNVFANVAFDLFADRNVTAAQVETEAAYEIMIWLGTTGTSQPLGYNGTDFLHQKLDDIDFTLYQGQNTRGTKVYSWYASTPQTNFSADITPLIQTLLQKNLVSSDAILGVVEFGSEAFYSTNNVTFSASGYSVDIVTEGSTATSPAPSPTPSSGGSSLVLPKGSWAGTLLAVVAFAHVIPCLSSSVLFFLS